MRKSIWCEYYAWPIASCLRVAAIARMYEGKLWLGELKVLQRLNFHLGAFPHCVSSQKLCRVTSLFLNLSDHHRLTLSLSSFTLLLFPTFSLNTAATAFAIVFQRQPSFRSCAALWHPSSKGVIKRVPLVQKKGKHLHIIRRITFYTSSLPTTPFQLLIKFNFS